MDNRFEAYVGIQDYSRYAPDDIDGVDPSYGIDVQTVDLYFPDNTGDAVHVPDPLIVLSDILPDDNYAKQPMTALAIQEETAGGSVERKISKSLLTNPEKQDYSVFVCLSVILFIFVLADAAF
jgi:hypothetical protein